MRGSRFGRVVCLTLVFVLLAAQAAFANGGIQGMLRRGNGGAMDGGHVQVYQAGSSVTGTFTADDGSWSFDLPAGDYNLLLQPMNPYYASAYWRSSILAPSYLLAQTVTVSDGTTQTIDATLPVAGTIRGSVTSGLTGGATKAVVDALWHDPITDQWVDLASTSINGTYTISGVFPGTYALTAGWGGWITDWYDRKTSFASADTTVVAGEGTVVYSPQLVPVGTPGVIKGVLHLDDGAPATGNWQYIYNSNGTFLKPSITAARADGSWEATVEPGDYKVYLRAGTGHGEGWWRHDGLTPLLSMAETVTASAGTTVSVDATSPLSGRISGSVTARASGSPIADFGVAAYYRNGAGQWERVTAQWSPFHGGSYSLMNFIPGTYRFAFEPDDPRFLSQFWNGKADLASATDVTLAEGQTATANAALSADVTGESVEGGGRIETAIAASKKMFPDATTHADAIILTTGYNWPDALGASALAGAVNAPVLLNSPAPANPMILPVLPTALSDEIARLKGNGATEVFILGDTRAFADLLERQLRSQFGPDKVHRLGGYGRYATSLAIATEVRARLGVSWDGFVFLAKGTDYPDALAAAPLAAREGWPVILAESDGRGGLSTRVKDFLLANATSKVIVLGSVNAVPQSMADAAEAVVGAGKVERWEGPDRVATAISIAQHSTSHGLDFSGIGVATAYNYPDALSAGPYLAKQGNPLLLTANALPLRPALASKLTSLSPEVAIVRFFGGPPAIGQNVRDAILDRLR